MRVQFLTADVAVMHAIGSTIMRGKSKPDPVRDSLQTLVAVREHGDWKLAAFQNKRGADPPDIANARLLVGWSV